MNDAKLFIIRIPPDPRSCSSSGIPKASPTKPNKKRNKKLQMIKAPRYPKSPAFKKNSRAAIFAFLNLDPDSVTQLNPDPKRYKNIQRTLLVSGSSQEYRKW